MTEQEEQEAQDFENGYEVNTEGERTDVESTGQESKVSQVTDKLTQPVSVMGKSFPLWIAFVIGIGSVGAVSTALIMGQFTGSGPVTQGMDFKVTSTSSNGQVLDNGGFSFEISQGGQFQFSMAKENLANDKTQPMVEMVVLDAGDTALNHKNLEMVRFQAEQTTEESSGSTVPAGRTLDYRMEWDSKGNLVTEKTGGYLDVGTIHADSDDVKEIVIGIGDSNGMHFGPSEHWNVDYTVDTQTSFPEVGELNVTATLAGMNNPQKGGMSAVAKKMPQY